MEFWASLISGWVSFFIKFWMFLFFIWLAPHLTSNLYAQQCVPWIYLFTSFAHFFHVQYKRDKKDKK